VIAAGVSIGGGVPVIAAGMSIGGAVPVIAAGVSIGGGVPVIAAGVSIGGGVPNAHKTAVIAAVIAADTAIACTLICDL
jgi:hypothetical protein